MFAAVTSCPETFVAVFGGYGNDALRTALRKESPRNQGSMNEALELKQVTPAFSGQEPANFRAAP